MSDSVPLANDSVWLSHHVGDSTHATHPEAIDTTLNDTIDPAITIPKTPGKKMPPVVPMLLTLVVLLGGLIAGTTMLGGKKELRSKAAANETSLTLSNPGETQANATYRVPITILSTTTASQTRTLAALDVNLTFPNNILTFVSFEPTMFPAAAPAAAHERLVQAGATNNMIRILEGAACTTAAPWSCGVPTVGTGKTLGTLVFTVKPDAAGKTGTIALDTANTIIASTDPLDINVFSGTAQSITVTVANATVTNPRDIASPAGATADGKVNPIDLGYVLQNPFPCGSGYAATCPAASLAKRDVSGPSRGVADGKVNSLDTGFILQNPYPCGTGYAAACQ